jgi:hypothetical protein
VIINTETQTDTNELLNKRLFAIKNQRMGGDTEELALIIGEQILSRPTVKSYNYRRQELNVRTGKGVLRRLPGIGNHVQGEPDEALNERD